MDDTYREFAEIVAALEDEDDGPCPVCAEHAEQDGTMWDQALVVEYPDGVWASHRLHVTDGPKPLWFETALGRRWLGYALVLAVAVTAALDPWAAVFPIVGLAALLLGHHQD